MIELNSRLITALAIWGLAGLGPLGCTDGGSDCNSDCGGAGAGGGSGDAVAGRAGAAASLAGSSAGGAAGAGDENAAGAGDQAGDSSETSGGGDSVGGSGGGSVGGSGDGSIGGSGGGSVGGSGGDSVGGSGDGSVGGSGGGSVGGSGGGSVGGSGGGSIGGSGGGSVGGSGDGSIGGSGGGSIGGNSGGSIGESGGGSVGGSGGGSVGGSGGAGTPDSPLNIGPAALPYAGWHAAYRTKLVAIGGSGAGYIFSAISGSLPAELSLAADGTLSGVPQQEGVFAFSVFVSDSHGNQAQASLELRVTRHRWLAYQLSPFLPLPALNLLDMTADGYPTTTLPPARSFKFSPDGHWLLYSTATELDVLDVSGDSLGAAVPLATGAFDQLKWSPDNDWVAYHDTASDRFRVQRISTGASATLGNVSPDFVASRWGTRVVFCQATTPPPPQAATYAYSYADLKDVTPTVPPTFQVLATKHAFVGGWVGDQYYVLAGLFNDDGSTYVKFGPIGVESFNVMSTSFDGYWVTMARHESPAIVLLTENTTPSYYPNLWFDFDTGQQVEWPRLGNDPPLSYAGSLSKFAVEGASGQAQIFQASQPHGTVLGIAPIRHGLSQDSQLVAWSPPENTVASVDWDNQVWVTWLDSSGVSLSAGTFSDLSTEVGGFNFGAQGDWVSFDGYRDGAWRRWFVAIGAKTLTPPQEFREASSSAPVEAPDHRTIALFDGSGLNLFPVSAGVLGTPHSLGALPNVPGDVLGAQWSTDSTHFVASPSNDFNGNYQLFIVDATSPSATPKVLGRSSIGYYSVQP